MTLDLYAPHFEVEINGELLPDIVSDLITHVSFEDNAKIMDMLTLTVSSDRVTDKEQIIDLLNSKYFNDGNMVILKMGYGNDLTFVGAGIIVKKTPSFSRNSLPSFTVTCFDKSHVMLNIQEKYFQGDRFSGKTDAEVVIQIASKHGFHFGTTTDFGGQTIQQTAGKHERVRKRGESDFEFMDRLAEINGFDWWVQYALVDSNNKKKWLWVLFFKEPIENTNSIYTFKYNPDFEIKPTTLLEFNPEINSTTQSVEYEIIGFNSNINKKVKNVQTESNKDFRWDNSTRTYIYDDRKESGSTSGTILNELKNPALVKFTAFGRSREIVTDEPIHDEADAKRLIRAWSKARKQLYVVGDGTILGNPLVKARQVQKLDGIGKELSGDYYFDRVLHEMGDGTNYEVNFTARKIVR